MDQNAVYQLFVSTYHPDPNVHKQAELNIRNVWVLLSVVKWSETHNRLYLVRVSGRLLASCVANPGF